MPNAVGRKDWAPQQIEPNNQSHQNEVFDTHLPTPRSQIHMLYIPFIPLTHQNLLLRPWSCHTSSDHTWQLFLPNARHQSDSPGHHTDECNRESGQQKEWHTYIFLLASWPTPVHGLHPAVVICDDGLGAFAGKAIDCTAGLLISSAVARTVVCRCDA